jgi:hypothetical protein
VGLLLQVNVDAVDDRLRDYGVGAKLYWARDNSSATGAFADAAGSVSLVDGQTSYEVYDPSGLEGHYYRTRVGNAGGTDFSSWSEVLRGGEETAYASVDSLRERLMLPDNSRDNVLADILRDATAWITNECGRSFVRQPQISGEQTRLYTLYRDQLWVEDDIVSLSNVEWSGGTGEPYTSLALATDYELIPSQGTKRFLMLTDVSSIDRFFVGTASVRLTGVFGYAEVPDLIRGATLEVAREMYNQSVGGRPVGLDFGRLPPMTQTAISKYRLMTFVFGGGNYVPTEPWAGL